MIKQAVWSGAHACLCQLCGGHRVLIRLGMQLFQMMQYSKMPAASWHSGFVWAYRPTYAVLDPGTGSMQKQTRHQVNKQQDTQISRPISGGKGKTAGRTCLLYLIHTRSRECHPQSSKILHDKRTTAADTQDSGTLCHPSDPCSRKHTNLGCQQQHYDA